MSQDVVVPQCTVREKGSGPKWKGFENEVVVVGGQWRRDGEILKLLSGSLSMGCGVKEMWDICSQLSCSHYPYCCNWSRSETRGKGREKVSRKKTVGIWW